MSVKRPTIFRQLSDTSSKCDTIVRCTLPLASVWEGVRAEKVMDWARDVTVRYQCCVVRGTKGHKIIISIQRYGRRRSFIPLFPMHKIDTLPARRSGVGTAILFQLCSFPFSSLPNLSWMRGGGGGPEPRPMRCLDLILQDGERERAIEMLQNTQCHSSLSIRTIVARWL